MTHNSHTLTNIGSESRRNASGAPSLGTSIFNLVRGRSPVRSNSDDDFRTPKHTEKLSSDIDDFGPAQRGPTSSGHGSSKTHQSSFRISRCDSDATGVPVSPDSSQHSASFRHTGSFRRAAGSLMKVTRSLSNDRTPARTESTCSIKAGDASVCPSIRQMSLDSSMCMCFASVNVHRKVRAENLRPSCATPPLCSPEFSNF